MTYDFDFAAIFTGDYPALMRGLLTTLSLTALAWLLAMGLGSVMAVIRLTGSRAANGVIWAFVAFHRNVPMLVHIMLWYFGIGSILPISVGDWLNRNGSEFILAMIAIGLVMSAYVTEDLRSAIRAIPGGQMEASRALGLSYLRSMRKVILPQAFRIAIPPLLNQTLLLFKNTSLAMAIGVVELTAAGREIENYTFRTFEAFAVVTVTYLCISFLIMWAGSALSKRYQYIGDADMWDILQNNWELLLIGQYPHGPIGGLVATLGLAAVSLLLAIPFSIVLALGRMSPYKVFYLPASGLVFIVRGLPLLMFIFWAYFFVPLIIGRPVAGATTMIVALVCYESAYLAEIIRAGVQALPPGQQEAGRALGLSYMQTMRRIILPQAMFNMLPSMLSQFISTVKETSLAYVISVQELTYAANQVNSVLLVKPFEVFGLLALTYFVLNLSLTGLVRLTERRIEKKRLGRQIIAQPVEVQP